MAIYSSKTNKLNYRKKRLRLGISLISVFSVLLLLIAFNFFDVLSIIVIGSFGLLFYPLCLFFIALGILIVLNKNIKVPKIIVGLSVAWLVVFVLIIHMLTSKSISISFSDYIVNTFKRDITAGGVIFSLVLYPLYYLTHTVATYIILSAVLVVLSAFLVDRVILYIKSRSVLSVTDVNTKDDNIIENIEEDEFSEELAVQSSTNTSFNNQIDEDIFIEDEEESEERVEAKNILGLNKTRTIQDLDDIAEQSKNEVKDDEDNIILNNPSSTSKPNIIVHEDTFDFNSSIVLNKKTEPTKEEIEKSKEDERKKAALDYLNISKGKFSAKDLPKGFDNVVEEKHKKDNQATNLQELKTQTVNNEARINNIQSTNVSTSTSTTKPDLYDENLTKDSFNKELFNKPANNFFPEQITLPNAPSSPANIIIPKKAQSVYTGEVADNIVEPVGPRPVQMSMNEPAKPTVEQKIYKKPPAVYVRPPIDLLKKYSSTIENEDEYIREKGEMIVQTLKNFKIETHIINAIKGPTFTRYELQMAPGIPVNTINSKINDLAMVLESSCRVQIPIPGKNAFGIEVPNKKRVMVGLRDIIESSEFQNSKSPLTFALGKDISNQPKVSSIDKLVHTLVAGSTGSGKSVCLQSMLLSLLYKSSPEDLKLLLVDPKMVEFGFYNGIPHMIIPNAITESDKAIQALNWLVEEMERRYKRLNQTGVRDIEGYNNSSEVRSGSLPKMYYIVMVFDEVGDYMVVAKKEIEEKVIRLAAKSRAAGIHLILTTQRPTVDVITGTIKANLPSRIAFAVNTYQDSKTIIDTAGAEMLLSKGDMLFLPKGSNDLDRIQCAFVHDDEIKSVVKFIKENNESDFDEEIEHQMFNANDGGFDPSNSAEEAFDSMMKDCLKYVIRSKRCSTSGLQAYFGIGYPRANKIILQMEKAAFISPNDGSNKRQIYITPQEFEERFGESIDE